MSPRLVAVLALVLGAPVPLAAQRSSAESAARNFFAAISAEDWRGAAALLDLDAFRPLVEQALEAARDFRPPADLTVEDILRREPGMPREVAAWQLQRIKQELAGETPDPLGHQFAGVAGPGALRALPLDQAAAAWLEAQDTRPRIREALTRKRCPIPSRDSLARLTRRDVLGAVQQGDSLAWAPHRSARAPADSAEPWLPGPAVLELRRRDGAWRVVPRYDLLGAPDLLEEELSCARPPARRVRPPGP